MNISTSKCGCNNDPRTNQTACDCCIPKSEWIFATPVCNNATQTTERCQCRNVTTNFTEIRQEVVQRNVSVSISCRKTGCNGELCSSRDMSSSCSWRDSFACYSSADCVYQPSTGDCGFTQTAALSSCLAKPAVIRPADIKNYQNATRIPNPPVNVTILQNVTVNNTYSLSRSRIDCTCANSRFPNISLVSPPINTDTCSAITNSSLAYQCCIDRSYVESVYFNQQQCSNGTTSADCNCGFGRNATCNCSPRNTIGLTLRQIVVPDTQRTCQCLNNSANTAQNCRCCIGSLESYIPRGPACNTTTSDSRSCVCSDVLVSSTNSTNYQCTCAQNVTVTRNVTDIIAVNTTVTVNQTVPANSTNATSGNRTNNSTSGNVTITVTRNVTTFAQVNRTVVEDVIQTFSTLVSPRQCSCLTYTNGSDTLIRQCNCCINKEFQCPAVNNTFRQNCICQNVTVGRTSQWSCDCLRSDNGVRRPQNFTSNLCGCNPADNNCQCCLNSTQVSAMVPVLNCPAQTQR